MEARVINVKYDKWFGFSGRTGIGGAIPEVGKVEDSIDDRGRVEGLNLAHIGAAIDCKNRIWLRTTPIRSKPWPDTLKEGGEHPHRPANIIAVVRSWPLGTVRGTHEVLDRFHKRKVCPSQGLVRLPGLEVRGGTRSVRIEVADHVTVTLINDHILARIERVLRPIIGPRMEMATGAGLHTVAPDLHVPE
jgi:hypothetical protein